MQVQSMRVRNSVRLLFGTICLLVLSFGLNLTARAENLTTVESQLSAMETILNELDTHYGMLQYKQKRFGITLDGLRSKYSRLIKNATTIEESLRWVEKENRKVLPAEEFRQLMIGMIAELRDGHVNLMRLSHSTFSVGLFTAMIDGKLYVTGFHKDLFVPSGATRQMDIGDEIVEVNGRPLTELAKENLPYIQDGTFESRYIEAMEFVLLRPHGLFRKVKEGDSVEIKFRRGEGTYTAHLNWINVAGLRYARSMYPNEFDLTTLRAQKQNIAVPFGSRGTVRSYFYSGLTAEDGPPPGVVTDIGALLNLELSQNAKSEANGDSDEEIGKGRPRREAKSLNLTATIAGASSEELPINPVTRLMAYTIRYQGKTFGVLRIPSYSSDSYENELNWITEVLRRFQNSVDLLIVDQLSNTGGSVDYGTRLISLLAGEKPLQSIMSNLRLNETLLYVAGSPEVQEVPGTGRLPNFAKDRLNKIEYDRLKEKLENGEQWSGFIPAFSPVTRSENEKMGMIVPDNRFSFSKPILFLNDNRSGSGGDFIPAILQANGRAVIYGETSAGLGGPVYRSIDSMPGSQMNFRCTMAYCERSDGLPIENVGVIPDIYRSVRPYDLESGFSTYTSDVLATAKNLLDGASPAGVQSLLAETQLFYDFQHANLDEPPGDSEAVMGVVRLFEKFTNSVAFKNASKDLDRGAAQLTKAYKNLLAKVRAAGQELKGPQWETLILPIPKSLIHSDTILASTWKRPETINRLREMAQLPQWKARPEAQKLIQIISQVLERIPGNIRAGSSCELLLDVRETVKIKSSKK